MTRRDEVFAVICEYSYIHNGNSPSIDVLLTDLHKRGYEFSRSRLQALLDQLRAEQPPRLIRDNDGLLIIPESEWIPPPER